MFGFRRRSHTQPTPCPLHGHLLWLLACPWDIKLYPINQSIKLLAVMKLSSCHHKSSGNKLQIVFDGGINPESSHSCAGFLPVCIHMALTKWSAYHYENGEIIVVITIMFGQCITSASTNHLASFSPVCVLMAVKKISTFRHQNSENKISITTNV